MVRPRLPRCRYGKQALFSEWRGSEVHTARHGPAGPRFRIEPDRHTEHGHPGAVERTGALDQYHITLIE
jgi:hypothetical protein